jgi:hypothetical protein
MGLLPDTGTAITMGRVRNAYGLSGAARLRADLAQAVNNNPVGTAPNINLSGQVGLSIDFGGRTTPNNY